MFNPLTELIEKRGGARVGAGRKHTGSKLHKLPGKLKHLKKTEEPPKPYGDVKYADAKDGKYPIDTEEHIRAAWNYINKPHNASVLDNAEAVKAHIVAAWKEKIDPAGPPSIQKTFNPLTGLIEKGGPGSGPRAGKSGIHAGYRVKINNPMEPKMHGRRGTVTERNKYGRGFHEVKVDNGAKYGFHQSTLQRIR